MARKAAPSPVGLTIKQERALLSLAAEIAAARQRGLSVPCVRDPVAFDQPDGPAHLCHGCPVLMLCESYRLTGAVTHGILAGGRAGAPARRRRKRRPGKALEVSSEAA